MTDTDFKALFRAGAVSLVGAGKFGYGTQCGYHYLLEVPRELNDVERNMIVRLVNLLLKAEPEVKRDDP